MLVKQRVCGKILCCWSLMKILDRKCQSEMILKSVLNINYEEIKYRNKLELSRTMIRYVGVVAVQSLSWHMLSLRSSNPQLKNKDFKNWFLLRFAYNQVRQNADKRTNLSIEAPIMSWKYLFWKFLTHSRK